MNANERCKLQATETCSTEQVGKELEVASKLEIMDRSLNTIHYTTEKLRNLLYDITKGHDLVPETKTGTSNEKEFTLASLLSDTPYSIEEETKKQVEIISAIEEILF